jgi:hypothetical protein
MRRFALWAVVLPLLLAGTEAAHALAYRIVYPVASVRWQVLAASGHGYLGYAPLAFGVGTAILFAGLASTAVDAACRRPVRPLPAWAFATLPVVGFAVQEFMERLLASDAVPWWTFAQPTFRVGVLLQLPFALVAYVAARVLLRVGRELGRTVAGRAPHVAVAAAPAMRRPVAAELPRSSVLPRGWSERGPPPLPA